jgi:hypothetical protein
VGPPGYVVLHINSIAMAGFPFLYTFSIRTVQLVSCADLVLII